MKVIITKDYDELSEKAAKVIIEIIKSNPYAVLGLATGTTPLGLYQKLIADHKKNGTSYKHIRAVNLDEYKGLPRDHKQSYAYFMRKNLFEHMDIDLENAYIENGMAENEKIRYGTEEYEKFKEALLYVNETLAKEMAGDGEGATALLEVKVVGAQSKKGRA